MSSRVRTVDCWFVIPQRLEGKALATFQRWGAAAVTDEGMSAAVADAETLDAAFAAIGWQLERDAEGQIERLKYDGEIAVWFFELDDLWHALARYAFAGCFIAMEDDDGEAWRWRFDGLRAIPEDGEEEE